VVVVERTTVAGVARRWLLVTGAFIVFVVPACSGDNHPPAAKPVSAEQQIVQQYRRLLTQTIPAASVAKPAARRSILTQTLMEPALTQALTRMARYDRLGQRPYGHDKLLRQTVQVKGTTAIVAGCVDESGTGVADGRTGRKLTVGGKTQPMVVRFQQGKDGVWRASAANSPFTTHC
jgi:hypothetical protein